MELRGVSAVRRRSMTNGNGGPQIAGLRSSAQRKRSPAAERTAGRRPWPGWPGRRLSGDPAQAGLPVPLSPGAPQRRRARRQRRRTAVRKGSPFSISNWRVRWRLVAIIAVPTITALILGVIQIVGSVNNYESFKRVQTLANLNALVVTATGRLADERDATAGYVAQAASVNGTPRRCRHRGQRPDRAATDQRPRPRSRPTRAAVVNGSGYRAQTVLDLTTACWPASATCRTSAQAAIDHADPGPLGHPELRPAAAPAVHRVQRRRRGRHRQRHPAVRRHGAQRAAAHGGRRLAAARLPVPGAGELAADPDPDRRSAT